MVEKIQVCLWHTCRAFNGLCLCVYFATYLRWTTLIAFVHGVDDFGIVETEMLRGSDGILIILISSNDGVFFAVLGEGFVV